MEMLAGKWREPVPGRLCMMFECMQDVFGLKKRGGKNYVNGGTMVKIGWMKTGLSGRELSGRTVSGMHSSGKPDRADGPAAFASAQSIYMTIHREISKILSNGCTTSPQRKGVENMDVKSILVVGDSLSKGGYL